MITLRLDTAIAMMEQVVVELPSYGTGVQSLMLPYWPAGRVEDARHMAVKKQRIVPDATLTSALKSSPYRRPEQLQLMIDAFSPIRLPG